MRTLVLATAIVLLASGCAGHVERTDPTSAASASSTPTAAPESTPTLTPTPTPNSIALTGLTPPRAIFDGDCGRLFSTAEITTIAGTTMKQYSYEDDEQGDATYRQRGIISCTWLSAKGNHSISMLVLRNVLAPNVPLQQCGVYTSGEASGMKDLCVFDAVSHGVRISGAVYWPTKVQSRAVDARLLAKFQAADYADEATRVPAVQAGSWPVVVSCDRIPSIPVDGKTVKLVTDILGSDAGTTPLADFLAGGDSHSGGCYGKYTADNGDEDNLEFTAIGGAGWRFDEIVKKISDEEHGEEVTIPGFDHAVHAQIDKTIDEYFLVSGPNYLGVTMFGGSDQAAVLQTIKEKLDALAP